jgi:lambda family phage tail tape measure protein
VAFQAMRLEVGKALQPLGAELQNAFAKFIQDVTPAVVTTVKALASALKVLVDNAGAIGNIAKFALTFGGVTLAIKAFIGTQSMLSATFAMLQAGFGNTTQAAIVAESRLTAFTSKVKLFARSVAAPLLITVAIVGADLVIKYFKRIKDAQDNLTKTVNAATGSEWLKSIGGTALDRQQLTQALDDVGKAYQSASDRVIKYQKQVNYLKEKGPTMVGSAAVAAAAQLTTAENELKLAKAQETLLGSRYRAGIARLPNAPAAAAETSQFPSPAGDEKGAESAAAKAARAAETRAAEQQRLNETLMQQRLRVEDAVFKHQVELDRQRYELQKRLDDIQADNRIARETGVSREIVSSFEQLRQRLREIDERSTEATRRTAAARQTLTSAQQQAAVTASTGAGMAGIYRQGSIGPTSTGPHFDVKRQDGGFFTRNALDQFVRVNGRPLSSGVTVPGGEFNAPRPGRARHGGYDYAFASGAGLSLTGGAEFVSSRRTAHGDETAFRTPDGSVYKLLHGKFEQGGKLPTGVAAQGLRAVRTAGTAGVETSDLAAARAQEAGILAAAPAERAATLTNFILNQTSALREQNATQQRNNELQAYRNTLTGQFADSGFVDLQVSLKEQQLLQNEAQAKYNILVTENPELSGVLGEVMQTQNALYAERTRLLTETYNAQQLLNGSMSAGFTAGAGQYLQSLGTLNQATAQLAQTGFKGVEDAIFDLVTTGTTNFAAFAASILRDTARMIIQQLVMKSIMQAIGFIGGPAAAVGNPTAPGGDVMGAIGRLLGNANGNAFATNNIVPYAMGGLVTKPTLFRYANGGVPSTGLMGEAGPEAIMPLRRLPNGRLGVESSTSGSPITVNVNVDAKGSSVEGDEGQSKALAGVISAAVQSELVKQKRPGGLLAGTR